MGCSGADATGIKTATSSSSRLRIRGSLLASISSTIRISSGNLLMSMCLISSCILPAPPVPGLIIAYAELSILLFFHAFPWAFLAYHLYLLHPCHPPADFHHPLLYAPQLQAWAFAECHRLRPQPLLEPALNSGIPGR